VGSSWSKIGIYAAMILLALIVLLPLLWLVSASLKTEEQLVQNIWGLPRTPVFSNYTEAWARSRMSYYMRNSLIVAASTILLTAGASATMSFALSRFTFRLNRLIYYIVIAGMMIPIHSAVIPLYVIALKWKLQNNLFTLAMIYAAFRIPVSVFLLEAFMLTIPKELEECAIIDGCGYWTIFWKIIMPLSRDGIVTIMILAALACWNELLVAMLMLSKPFLKTVPAGVLGFISEFSTDYARLYAGLVIAIVPNLVFYAVMQERIVKGMTVGAVKG
jgi:raffinose/stachyose/melibiose transport system permease protein